MKCDTGGRSLRLKFRRPIILSHRAPAAQDDRTEAEKQFKKALHKNPELRSAQLNLQRLAREPAVAGEPPTVAVP